MSYTDDPGHDAYMRDMEHMDFLKSRPICCVCREPIQTEKAIKIEHAYICWDCAHEHTVYLED